MEREREGRERKKRSFKHSEYRCITSGSCIESDKRVPSPYRRFFTVYRRETTGNCPRNNIFHPPFLASPFFLLSFLLFPFSSFLFIFSPFLPFCPVEREDLVNSAVKERVSCIILSQITRRGYNKLVLRCYLHRIIKNCLIVLETGYRALKKKIRLVN